MINALTEISGNDSLINLSMQFSLGRTNGAAVHNNLLTGGDMEWKVFNDVVHGHMEFHPLLVSIIDTPQFQRLRYLKQTGPCYFVYPSSLHSRFEHSLGTAFLAGKLMNLINRKRGFFGEEAKKETLTVQIAGLCHDLGHGPFSHTWEMFLKRCGREWRHETYSVEIFKQILEETVPDSNYPEKNVTIRDLFRNYGLEDFIPKIEIMITGVMGFTEKKYLYQIISNKENSIDVDKWDYLMRDSKMTNVPINFNCDRMLLFCQIFKTSQGNEEICYRDKECSNLLNMFLTRGLLHDKIYQHRKVKVIEEMLIEVFCLADNTLNLSTKNIDSFLKLTDHIYQKILYEDFEGNEAMAKAKKILQRIERRKLYICIAACKTKVHIDDQEIEKIEEELHQRLSQKNTTLRRDLIKIIKISIDMTEYNKRKNLENVRIYKKQKTENEEVICNFDWDNFNSIKPDLKPLSLNELLVVYKGEEYSKYQERCYDHLLVSILEQFGYE